VLKACIGVPDNLNQQDLTSAGGINPLSYLGDSFDASTDLFTAEDALKLGLDPLEIEELQMLADASIVADPATEDSFRLDRQ
jgi:CREB-regulated transcription coactivator 1